MMLAESFFPKKLMNTAAIAKQNEYPPPACKAHKISKEQIRRHLKRLKPYKAPGPDGIPNIVLLQCADLLIDRLWHIFNAILVKEIYYAPWKHSITVVLRKPGKPRYDMPKAYRPIALLNTLGKLLTAVIAEQLTYYTEKHALLPPTHFGGRPGRTTMDALHVTNQGIGPRRTDTEALVTRETSAGRSPLVPCRCRAGRTVGNSRGHSLVQYPGVWE